MTLLHVDSSILNEQSVSRQLTAAIVKHLSAAKPDARIIHTDLAADIIIVGAPMYNFTLPTQLRAWLDRLAVPGKTFRYSENGAEGLAKDKRVIVASTRGGLYGEGAPSAFLDHQETYLRSFFGFLGITDITFIRAEGLALGPENRTAAIDAAVSQVGSLTA